MRHTLYSLLLRLFPEREYTGARWGAFQRFDIDTKGTGSKEDELDLYLRRFVLLKTPWGGIYLHHIVRSDRDRALHDHPWPFVSVILWGGYYEETPGNHWPRRDYWRPLSERRVVAWKAPGSIRYCPARWLHRVQLRSTGSGREIPAWSLVLTGPRQREWGFWCKDRWVPWRQFDAVKEEC